jgi:hypothetical protein
LTSEVVGVDLEVCASVPHRLDQIVRNLATTAHLITRPGDVLITSLSFLQIGLIYASVFQLGLKAFSISPFPNASIVIGILGYCATSNFDVSQHLQRCC